MKIENGRGVSSAGGVRRSGGARAAASGFAPAGVDEPQRVAGTAPASAITPLDAILALQGDERGQRRARQARRGRDALDALDKLAQAMLMGIAPASLRADLDALQRGAEQTGEPGLDDVLQEIDIRLAVEAAKLDRMLGRA
ncbi:MAG: flagellar assembly protein FliX [Hyphomonadaceae bacterium]|nr:flagellar assembly protein FliX [Hyphomonadaceae bacterium]